MLNTITIMGRLTADVELKTTQKSDSVCSFSVAVERNYKDADGKYPVDFIEVVAWRQTAEFVSRYFGKGSIIAVQGSLQSRKWQAKDGSNRIAWEVIAERVCFAGSGKTSEPQTEAAAVLPAENGTEYAPVNNTSLPF